MNGYEQLQWEAIETWKREEPWVVAKAINTLFSPVSRLVEGLIPVDALTFALESASTVGERLADISDILRDAKAESLADLRKGNLQELDYIANQVHNWAIGMATTEGGLVGSVGLAALAAEVPVTVTFALRTVYKIARCYGFDCSSERDRHFVLGILATACANSGLEKITSLASLQAVRDGGRTGPFAERRAGKAPVALRGLAKQLGVNLAKRKALQVFPAVGAVVGASVNGVYIKDVGWAARRLFQERWLSEKRERSSNNWFSIWRNAAGG